jgi:hypothetical protein
VREVLSRPVLLLRVRVRVEETRWVWMSRRWKQRTRTVEREKGGEEEERGSEEGSVR